MSSNSIAEPNIRSPNDRSIAPPVGALFEYNGGRYRCTAWLRPADPPKPVSGWDDFINHLLYETSYQRDGVRFQYCRREEATHVSGSGVCGCLADIGAIRVTGHVEWSADLLRGAELHALALASSGRLVG